MAGRLLLVKYYWLNNYVTVSTCSSKSQGSCCFSTVPALWQHQPVRPHLVFPLRHPLHYGPTGWHRKFLGYRKKSSFKVIFYRGLTEKSSDNTKLTWHTIFDFGNKKAKYIFLQSGSDILTAKWLQAWGFLVLNFLLHSQKFILFHLTPFIYSSSEFSLLLCFSFKPARSNSSQCPCPVLHPLLSQVLAAQTQMTAFSHQCFLYFLLKDATLQHGVLSNSPTANSIPNLLAGLRSLMFLP